MKNLYILAPNDRFNYGDLMFPYVIRTYFHDIVDRIVFCSTTRSDLSKYGGFKTKGHSVLYRLKSLDKNILMVAGGESMFVGWTCIYSYVNPLISYVAKSLETKDSYLMLKLGNEKLSRLLHFLTRLFARPRTVYPYTIGRHELPHLDCVLYNSVGGTNIHNFPGALDKDSLSVLEDSDYLAVRDGRTHQTLAEHHVETNLVADSVIMISDMFDEAFLEKKTSLPQSVFKGNPYLFFQVNLGIAQRYYPLIVETLRQLKERLGCRICLCPIGTALGHEDDVALAYIYDQLKADDDVRLISSPSVWDIISLIKHARLYVGTSLHGVITSMSYGVPFVGVEVMKVEEYIKTWAEDRVDCHFCQMDNIIATAQKALEDTYDCSKQKETVKRSIDKMREIIRQV